MLEFGCPHNNVEFSSAEVYHSICALLKKRGYEPKSVMATDMPTGNRTGPWKTSVAGKVALELALDGAITIFPNNSDGRDPLELTVHVLNEDGTQIRAEKVRRPPMSEEEKQAKRDRRVVLYAELPPEMLNVNPEVHAARMNYFKTTIASHFMKNGAEHVGFCQARDNEGNNCNRTIIFIEIPARGVTPKEFAVSTLPGTKYVDTKCRFPAKLKLAKTGDYGLLGCCFKEKCTTGVGPRGAQTCDARNYCMDNEGVRKADRDGMIGFGASAPRGTKRAIDVEKELKNASSVAGVQASFELTECIQTCRAFQAGRCIKYHDDSLPDGHARKCPETHDMAKKEIKCCSILEPGDRHYKKGFRTCRYKIIGEPCQYICSSNEMGE